ncbi:MAG: diacylglycerol kinase family lipid kinase [Treponema sp.]|jgi:YegS/Rv2252/BmrU family lipid kinase|nr:diacylglycerol kinase family lipid kinase [Treponema sp.]
METLDIRKVWVILNPVAGKGWAVKQYPVIERFFKEKGQDFEIYQTKEPGDGLKFVQECPFDARDAVVAAGGDGTSNEVVNGLLTHKTPLARLPLFGLLPIGRGNDFSSSVGISEKPLEALETLLHGRERPLDAGLVKGGFFPDGRYFVNGIGIGFDTKVGFDAANMRHIHGAFAYTLGAVYNVARFEASPILEIHYGDKQVTLPAIIVSIMNGRRMGGSFFMGPSAELDDGLFDLCLLRHPHSRRRLLYLVLQYFKGTQVTKEEATVGRAAEFHLKALEGGMAAHCDGETVCYEGKDLTITCVPHALRLIGLPDEEP